MILYFDTLITEKTFGGKVRKNRIDSFRKKSSSYSKQSRINIAMYSLASYSIYNWSDVLVRYELDDAQQYKGFDAFILSLYPKATIIHDRSDSQNDYLKSLSLLKKMNGDWIFYVPNNDHPLVTSKSNIQDYIDSMVILAEKWSKKNRFVSIVYSHYTEFINIPKKGTPENLLFGSGTKILKDDTKALIYSKPGGEFSSIQIVNKDMMTHWFSSINLKKRRVVRSEDLSEEVKILEQIVIVPKIELCAHYDGYEHMNNLPNLIRPNQIPPLFIPKGFFENDIKIAYGFDEYKKGWVNVNPCAKKYIFEDIRYGTDLKLTLDQLPLFWKERTSQILKNSRLSEQRIKTCMAKQKKIKDNPWKLINQGLCIETGKSRYLRIIYRTNIFLRHFIRKISV